MKKIVTIINLIFAIQLFITNSIIAMASQPTIIQEQMMTFEKDGDLHVIPKLILPLEQTQLFSIRPMTSSVGFSYDKSLAQVEINKPKPYGESKVRRAEIIFIIALPFVLLAHAAIVGTVYFAGSKDANINIPNEALGFMAASSLITTVAITYHDYKENWREKEKDAANIDSISSDLLGRKKNLQFSLGYAYKF